MKYKNYKAAIAVCCLIAAGFCYSREWPDSGSADILQDIVQEESLPEESPEAFCYVHICGEVKVPGVYEVKEGCRIFQLVEMAGGFTDEAANGYLNMAETVTDGMKIVVPGKSELADSGFQTTEAADGRINLNTASREQLMGLNGIGASRADAIISYRETSGKFKKIEDVMNIPGIKETLFEKIKNDITV